MEDTDLVALRKHIQGLQAGNGDLLSRCAGEKKLKMDTLRKIYTEKKKSSWLPWEVKNLK